MGFPDRIERTVELAHPPRTVWAALTAAEGLGTWFGNEATIDLRPGGPARMRWDGGPTVDMADPTRRAILAALARDWDGPLDALKDHLDRGTRGPCPTPPGPTRGHHG